MTREVVTTTVTKEYDETGKLVKETTETVTETDHVVAYQHIYWPTYPTYPQYPSITWTSGGQIGGTQAAAGPHVLHQRDYELMGHFRYGRRAAIHPVGLGLIDRYLSDGLPSAPATFDHTNGFDGFQMLGNGPDPTLHVNNGQPVGDCGVVGAVNVDLIDSVETGEPFTVPTSDTVVTDYLRYNHGQDKGVSLSAFLAYWQKCGLPWSKPIAGFAPVNFRDPEAFWAACNAFGCLYVGIAVPATMDEQVMNGQTLDLTGTADDYRIMGGHCVVVLSRTSGGGELVTWGQRVAFTDRWWQTYGEEAHVVLTPQQVEKAGNGYGLDLAALQADLGRLR